MLNKTMQSLKKEIDDSIKDLVNIIKLYKPVELLYYLKSMEMVPDISEFHEDTLLIKQDRMQTNMIEYFINLLTVFNISDFKNMDVNESIVYDLKSKYMNIMALMHQYFLLHTNSDEFKLEHDDVEIDYMYNRFIYSCVTGKRYNCFENKFYNTMLKIHIDEIEKIFNINKVSFFSGLNKIMNKSSGNKFLEGMELLKELMDSFEENKIPIDKISDYDDLISENEKQKIVEAFTYEQYIIDSQEIWNKNLLEALSINFGDNTMFFDGDYAGWPINNTLHKYRPIIKIDNDYFCFDYYNFVDNFYRTIYKAIVSKDKKYAQTWQKLQKEVTENQVGKIFKTIFPNADVLLDNYYYVDNIKSNRSENDIIVLYDSTLFIIEVKAGNYTPDNPFVNFSSHKKSITELIEKPNQQCNALLNYLEKYQDIYNEKNEVKYQINIDNYKNIFLFSVTLENFNEVSSIIEKFENINFNRGNFLISIDDLYIYSDYFANQPIPFLDYLKYRYNVTKSKNLHVNDELDYLGLYLSYRDFPKEVEELIEKEDPDGTTEVFFKDARYELDSYYDSKQTPLSIQKPKPAWLEAEMEQLINLVYKSKHVKKLELIELLLDVAYETHLTTDSYLKSVINKIKSAQAKVEDNLFVSTVTVNSSEINLVYPYVKLTNQIINTAKMRSLAKLKLNHLDESYIIFIELNKDRKLSKIKIEYIQFSDIKNRNQKTLDDIGKKIFNLRKENLMGRLSVTIYPDSETCPCGSKKPYGECCKLKGL